MNTSTADAAWDRKHLLDLTDLTSADVRSLLDLAVDLKGTPRPGLLAGRALAMVFEKPSLRTRVSFERAMHRLGGVALNLRPDEIGLGSREEPRDVARVLGGMVDGIMCRLFDHATLIEVAGHAPVPVVNGLTDRSHPCQALADALTIVERFGRTDGLTVAYVGDGNNVARSLAVACARLGMAFRSATPPGHELPTGDLPGVPIEATTDPRIAADGADVLYTDTWTSMGQEAEKQARLRAFGGFTVDDALLDRAADGAIVLHCLPAYRGLEISDAVMESPRCLAFPQAHNRLHAQAAVLARLLGGA